MDDPKKKNAFFYNDPNDLVNGENQKKLEKETTKKVESICLGQELLMTWYNVPKIHHSYHGKCLYVCDVCFALFNEKKRA